MPQITPTGAAEAEAPAAAAPAVPAAAAHAAGPGAASAAPVSNEVKYGVLVGTIIIPILGLVMGVIYLMDANPEKKAAGKLWLSAAGAMMLVYCFLAMLGGGY